MLAALVLAGAAAPGLAGPPYQTDDPEPTDLHHWEIYSFATLDGHRSNFDGATGVDLNYGAAEGLQLTATLPIAFEHVAGAGWRSGFGDVEIGAKYRFIRDEEHGIQAAIFPRVILPTADRGLGGHQVRLLLPLWAQKDLKDGTSLFGGGGYEINPGAGNRNFWQAGMALTHDFSTRLSLGTEVTWQSADTSDGKSSVGVNLGLIRKLGGPASLLLAAGPSFSGGQTSYHSYVALGFAF
jgi:opacity protein-like surface antigen